MASKWSVPKILLGCAVLMVLFCGGGIALVVFLFPDVWKAAQGEFTKAMDWEQFAQSWQPPPADAGPERLFPATVGDFQREKTDDKAAAPNLEIMLPGRRATYKSGQETMEVTAYPDVSKADEEALVKRLNAKPFSLKMDVHTGNFARFTYQTGEEKGLLWWSKNWLFLARGNTTSDPEKFLRAYLAELAKAPPAEPQQDKKPGNGGGDF